MRHPVSTRSGGGKDGCAPMSARSPALIMSAALLLLAACTQVSETEPLPWLRVKKIHYKQFGGWAGGSTEYQYYVKRFNFVWLKLDETATGMAVALDGEHAAIAT